MTDKDITYLIYNKRDFSREFILNYEKEWNEAVEKLKKSNYDLSSIKIVQRARK